MNKIFQNDSVIILDKPPGVLSVPSRWGERDLRPVVGIDLQKELGRQVYPVHRLDEEVSGLLIFALAEVAHRELNKAFEKREISKRYQAISTRWAEKNLNAKMQTLSLEEKLKLDGTELIWRSRLLRGKKRAYESPHGKDSETRAACVKFDDRQILWNLNPVTGRPHQLRYEMYKRQIPIFGDLLYGSDEIWPAGGIALRCVELKFPERISTLLSIPLQVEIPGFSI